MGFHFNINKEQVLRPEPANEVLIEVIMPWLLFGGMVAVAACIRVISDWRNKRTQEKESPVDKMKNYLSSISFETLATKAEEIPNSRTINDPSGKGAHHAVDFKIFLDAAAVLKDASKVLESSSGKKGSIANIKKFSSELESKIPVNKNTDGSLSIEFDDSGIVWPTDIWYRDAKGCNNKFWQELSVSVETGKHLISKVNAIIDAPTDNVSQEELNDRIAYVNACVLFTMLVYGTFHGYVSNLSTIAEETEVSW